MDTRRGRRLRAAAALVVAAFATLVAAPAAVAAPALTPAPVTAALPGEELNELVEPSIVHLTIAWNGYVRFPSDEGWIWSDPIDVAYGCSGFFVTETGHIMTAGHCVEPDSGKEEVIKAFLQSQVDLGVLTPEDAGALLPGALLDWPVEGRGAGAPMDRVIQAVQPRAVEGAVLEQPLNAQLIDFRSFDEGDLALLKVETNGAVPVPIADADPRSGSPLTAVGFPGAVGQVVDVNLVRASFKTGTVSSTQVSASGVAQTEVNADMSGGMSGGPTVDGVGNVLGVNSFRINGETQAFNFITDTTDLSEWLGAKNLQLPQLRTAPVTTPAAPPPAAQDAAPAGQSFAGLPVWVWIVIAAGVVAVVAAVIIVVLLRGRRSKPVQAVPAAPQWGGRPPAQWGGPQAHVNAHNAQNAQWMPRQQQPVTPQAPQAAPAPQANASAPTVAVTPDGVLCGRCGQRSSTGTRFCSGCGSPLV